jgi:hypothetical protein
MANFNETKNPCPFGWFDANPIFQKDADKVIYFVLRKHSEEILSVELTKKQIWACFEEATLQFNANIIEYQAKSNLTSLLGSTTGSVDPNDPNTANLSINLVNSYVSPNLEFLVRQAEPYSAEIGYGQSKGTVSGAIQLVQGKQDYDLYTDLQDSNGVPLFNLMPSESQGRMRVVEVFHGAPIQYVFNSNLASNFVASGLPVESYVPDTRFHILPLFEDVLRAGMLKEAQRTRRSHYRYRITGRQIRFYPMPTNPISGLDSAVWVRVNFPSNPALEVVNGGSSSSISGSISGTGGAIFPNSTIYGASSPANIPLGLINYSTLNPWAKNWIFQYTLALATELLGRTRSKFKSIPLGTGDLQLNGDDLVAQGREDKERLLSGENGLISTLDKLTFDKLAILEADRAEAQLRQLNTMPISPKVVISIR